MNKRLWLLLLCLLAFSLVTPAPASADVGSTIVARFWDSLQMTMRNRLTAQNQMTGQMLQQAEQLFLGESEDITTNSAIQDVYKGMRVAGLLLLALCTVISLGEVTEAGMMGYSSNLADWFKRFAVATFMTIGSIQFYGLWIRIFNALLAGLRTYLDAHWSAPADTSQAWLLITEMLTHSHDTLLLLFVIIALVVLLVLWFLVGGIRMAEMAIAVIIAPLVWPVYLIPSLEDIPRTAFRSFLGLNGVLIIIVGMLRLALRMFIGADLAASIWNLVPALSVLMMTIFLPAMVKRLVGQGHTGAGGLLTVANTLVGLKGLSMAVGSAAAGSMVRPPAAAAIPQTPSSPSFYPLAPVPMGGTVAAGGTQAQIPLYETWAGTQTALPAAPGPMAAPIEPIVISGRGGQVTTIDMGQSSPNSGKFDTVLAIHGFDTDPPRARPIRLDPDPE